jgi:hypothetical protein
MIVAPPLAKEFPTYCQQKPASTSANEVEAKDKTFIQTKPRVSARFAKTSSAFL